MTGSEDVVKVCIEARVAGKRVKERGGVKNLLSHGQHLLFLMLIVIHLSTLGKILIPHLRMKQKEEVWMTSIKTEDYWDENYRVVSQLGERWAARLQSYQSLWQQALSLLQKQGSRPSEPGAILSATCNDHCEDESIRAGLFFFHWHWNMFNWIMFGHNQFALWQIQTYLTKQTVARIIATVPTATHDEIRTVDW